MKCLNRIDMQEYVDKEVAPETEALISEHLKSCVVCQELHNLVHKDKDLISKVLSQADFSEDDSDVPQFVPPVAGRKRIYLRTIAVAAAAVITAFIFLVRTGRKPERIPVPEAEILLHDFYEGKDLNKMWHEKSQIIILHDENGNIIHPLITY